VLVMLATLLLVGLLPSTALWLPGLVYGK
jgi:hypothetical protein